MTVSRILLPRIAPALAVVGIGQPAAPMFPSRAVGVVVAPPTGHTDVWVTHRGFVPPAAPIAFRPMAP